MQIFVKTLTGKTIDAEAEATPPVAAMMGSIGLQEADTDVDTEVDPEEEPRAPQKRRCPMRPEKGRWTRRQAPGEVLMPHAPQAWPPPSCPLLALLAQVPEPWKRQEREQLHDAPL